jgi:hypothetical protein
MDKKITITDKSAISKFKKKDNNRSICSTNKWNNLDNNIYSNHILQLKYINELFSCNIGLEKEIDNSTNTYYNILISEITKKIQSYKKQDIDKTKYEYNNELFVSLKDVIELLHKSNLNCYYCKKNVFILYKNVRQNNQWTLDRIDNDIGHHKENCVICCLRCNIQRRLTDDKKFLFTKQMNIVKNE